MGETGVGSGAGATIGDPLGVGERGGEEEEVGEEDHIETDLPMEEEVKGTHQGEDRATEKIGLIIIDAPHPRRPNPTTLHLGKAETAGLGMVSQLQNLPMPAPGNRMDQEIHPGRLTAPGGLLVIAMGLVIRSPERATDLPEILLLERALGQESHWQEKVTGQVIQFLGTAMQQETPPKETAMDLANHPEKAMDQETCPERATVVLGKATAQGTNQGQATVPGMQPPQEELMDQGQLQERHMAQPQHTVVHLPREKQDHHQEDPMMQGPPLQGNCNLIFFLKHLVIFVSFNGSFLRYR